MPANEKSNTELNVLSLQWVFGMNKDLIGGVHNLSDNLRKELFYVSGHVGVIYNYEQHQQTLLQGHINEITCTCVSSDKRWIITADSGEDSMIVVWDSVKGIPVKTIFNAHPNGVAAIDMSHNSMYIASLSHVTMTDVAEKRCQEISIWDWTDQSSDPIYSQSIPLGDVQFNVKFHYSYPSLLVTNGRKRVIFWSWKDGTLESYSPPVSSKEFRVPVGDFTTTIFVTNSGLAATGTKDGDIVMWKGSNNHSIERSSLKVVRVHNSSINYITCVGKYIVTGGEEGYVQFFDHQLRVEAWFEEFYYGSITSISFEKPTFAFQETFTESTGEQSDNNSIASSKAEGSAPSEGDFKAPDFIISTSSAHIIYAYADSFVSYNKERLRGEVLVQGQDGPIQSLAAHPKRPLLAIAGLSGRLHMWDYIKKKLLSITICKNMISCIAFDQKGDYLVVAGANGVVKILDGNKLEELQSFRPCKASITYLSFSHDSLFFAFVDSDNCVGLFRWGNRDEDDRKPIEWVYVGRFKGHKKPITGLQFGVVPFGDVARLMSVGEDRRLVEYDLKKSSIHKGVKIKAVFKIGQSEIPTNFLWTREKLTEKYIGEKDDFDKILFATNDYKFMVYTTPSDNTEASCTRTMLCPMFGGPINKLVLVPHFQYSDKEKGYERVMSRYIAYSTRERVVGICLIPLDGNLNKSMALKAHSKEITGCVCSPDGKYLFTAGGTDSTVNQWLIRGDLLEKECSKQSEIDIFAEQLEGGKNGKLFAEVKQYFYYAQIRSQGEVTTNERKITGLVPINQIQYMIRGLGFYATEREIQNMMSEVRAILSANPSEQKDEDLLIDFDTFLKVFVNHRPVIGIQTTDIEDAFKKLGADKSTGTISRDYLFQILIEKGEKMNPQELQNRLEVLLSTFKDGTIGNHISALEFAKKPLGFEAINNYDDDDDDDDDDQKAGIDQVADEENDEDLRGQAYSEFFE